MIEIVKELGHRQILKGLMFLGKVGVSRKSRTCSMLLPIRAEEVKDRG